MNGTVISTLRNSAGLVLCIMFVAGCGSPPDLLETIRHRGVIRVGVKTDSPPFGWRDGKFGFYGFDVDMAGAIADEIGIDRVEFVPVTSAERIEKVLTDEVDMVMASMTITRKRDQAVDFTIPYFQDGQGLMVRADSSVRDYTDLAGAAAGCVRGTTSIANLRQVQPDAVIREYAGYRELRDALAAGEVEAITTDMMILMGLKLNAPDPKAFRITGGRFSTEPYGIAVKENQSNLRDALNDAIQRLWEKGRWQRIFEDWFGENARYSTDVQFVIVPYPP